ncbi:bifunctional ADP-dependent NAD(P)H-hydrate dehydratase/NAD(P)H-hydrate epimerase [Aliagarivorans marinus]|uniref:bifunctional ADP-dependent NAD(P)H-hydrate dehydratase/NAD(P)H-hydrate epimerase n=1 Tax=Aliagarivorans marinus TaxID=561965 RepID=UPI0003FF30E3|nr:bifunctional ADP-dependent NAD(P)H-hydrate dehydratase/NAD(P)H-hydrate epimerase [Aliagarivorans marinus]
MAQMQGNLSASLPYSVWRAELVKDQEAKLAEQHDISLAALMELAGKAVFETLTTRWPEAKQILVLAGGGNNGGDAYVVARLAQAAGLQVQVVEVGDPERLPEQAATARDNWLADGGEAESAQWAEWHSDVIVDGLLGTGANGEVREPYKQLIEKANSVDTPVLAIDLPSGLCGNTGKPRESVMMADCTVTFIAAKQGLFTGLAAAVVGELVFAGLGLDAAFEEQNKTCVERINPESLFSLLKPRSPVAHKGNFGRVAILGGNIGMPGAIRLAGEASLRSGAGLVNILTRSEHQKSVLSGRPELMVAGIESGEQTLLANLLDKANTAVIGPGLDTDEWASELLTACLERDFPLLVDADGLNLLTKMPKWRGNWILTPHPAEAARLLACSVAEIEDDRITAARNIQQSFGGICVLKGAGTIIAGDNGRVRISSAGNPGMASGGMGDVLSGIIGGLLAQFAESIDLFDIACIGVTIHGMAADLAAEQGQRGLLASDLMPYVRQLVNPQ